MNSTLRTIEDMECFFPASLQEALEYLADEKTCGRPLAGGTDLMVQWEAGALPIPEKIVNVLNLPELKGISEENGLIVIGGGVTHTEIRGSSLVLQYLPSLAAAAATVGGFQMQNMGTIAGSMANASPAGDPEPSLLITDGTVIVGSLSDEREIPLRNFWKGY